MAEHNCTANACIDLRTLDQTAARYNEASASTLLESMQNHQVQSYAMREQTIEGMRNHSYSDLVAKLKAIGVTFN